MEFSALPLDERLRIAGELYDAAETVDTVPQFFDGNRFLHNLMGDYLIRKHGVCKINGAVHIYDNGVYRQGEDALHGYMIKLVPTLSDSRRREVFKYIKSSLDTPVKELSPPHLIPFKTQIYDIENEAFINYSSDYVFLNRFPYDYVPDAPDCDSIINTIATIAGHDPHVINLLCEAMGNCFYLLNSYRGAVMLYGRSGNNGKSTLLNIIVQMLGRENASHLSLQDTSERFRLVEVYGKAVNVGDDIPATYLPDSSLFKRLVTGEYITAERKGQDAFSFEPYAKMFFAMNGLPPISDRSKAFFSRVILIPLEADFAASGKRDVTLKSRIWTREEMECIVKYAMLGLRRLMFNGEFTKPECVTQALREYELESNPVLGFIEDYGADAIIGEPTAWVYQSFKNWSDAAGHKNIITRHKFSREMCDALNVTTAPKRHKFFDGNIGRCFAKEENG